jgi:DNA-binding XRE family transcriptional regulator
VSTLTYVTGAERMITAARVREDGSYVQFADEHSGVIPWAELRLTSPLERLVVPRPHVIEMHLVGGGVEELPWNFARHFADERYRASAEAASARGRLVLGERIRALRSRRGDSQHELARRARVNRVSIARIEGGHQLPRYRTLVALAKALDVPLDRLLVG